VGKPALDASGCGNDNRLRYFNEQLAGKILARGVACKKYKEEPLKAYG
jgi:hypothetical protein